MYAERIVLYIDILGFKEIVSKETFEGVDRIYSRFNEMISNSDSTFTNRLNIHAQAIAKKLEIPFQSVKFDKKDAELIFFSDCVVWSYPIDKLPKIDFLFVLLGLCGSIDILLSVLFHEGILIRGGVSIGNLYVKGQKVFGPALVRAYELERMAQYPRIVFDSTLVNKLSSKKLYKPFLKYKLCFNPKGFYAHNHFDVFRLLQAGAGIMSDKDDKRIEQILKDTWETPIEKVILSGMQIKNDDVRKKYEWLNAKLNSFRSSPIGETFGS